jgi:hypothetical protein
MAIAASSCRSKNHTGSVELVKTDSSNCFQVTTFSEVEKFELKIRNTSKEAASFYITPTAIDLFSDSTIIAGLLNRQMADEQKCVTLWKFVCDWTYHAQPLSTTDQTINDPAIMLNGFQYGICDDRNAVLSNLAWFSGIPSRVYELSGHVVAEMYYDSSWHMFDADKHIFYRDGNGKIASVAYLSQHPEIIDKKEAELKTVADRIRNERTKAAIISTNDNKVNSLYNIQESTYSSSIQLSSESQLLFKSESVGYFQKMISIYLLSRNGPFYNNYGKQTAQFDLDSTLMISEDAYTITQQLPFPIKRINLKTKKSCRVYYSCDGVNWYFKGITGNGLSSISFLPFNGSGVGFAFKYYLKLVSDDSGADESCFIENEFMFSDRIFVHNPSHAFKIIPQSKAALQMQVKLRIDN